jgi:hypothetical protein
MYIWKVLVCSYEWNKSDVLSVSALFLNWGTGNGEHIYPCSAHKQGTRSWPWKSRAHDNINVLSKSDYFKYVNILIYIYVKISYALKKTASTNPHPTPLLHCQHQHFQCGRWIPLFKDFLQFLFHKFGLTLLKRD